MTSMQFLASPISKSFSEAIRIDTEVGTWIFVAGQVGVPIPPTGAQMDFDDEVRTTFDRIGASLEKCGASLSDLVNIKVYLTDLSLYGTFSTIRGEVFPSNPPTSSAFGVAALLLDARIEIDGVAFLPHEKP